jgi:hypothetical protein
MKQVYVARDAVDAQIVCDILLDAGIDAVVERDAVPIATAPFPSVWVPEPDVERARTILVAHGISRS